MSSKKHRKARPAPRPVGPPPGIVYRPAGHLPNRAARRAKLLKTRVPRPLAQLSDDGEIGYYADPMRSDDCFRAAIATATQIDVEQVPDLRLHERHEAGHDPDEISAESWERIARWAHRRGLQITRHERVPAARERWIGVCVTAWLYEENPFADHCLVMSYDSVIFDPSRRVVAPRGTRVRTWQARHVTYGLSFDPREKE